VIGPEVLVGLVLWLVAFASGQSGLVEVVAIGSTGSVAFMPRPAVRRVGLRGVRRAVRRVVGARVAA
jgi:hypothetical protein